MDYLPELAASSAGNDELRILGRLSLIMRRCNGLIVTA
jgi:hypothetical protein